MQGMIIVQQAVAPVRNRKEKRLMLKEKSLQVFTDPENPNHENHDFVA
jgi:hypothetical protein